ELDATVDIALPVRAARIGEDRAVAEGTRPIFHRAVKPADDEPVGERLRDSLVVPLAIFHAVVNETLGAQRRFDLVIPECWAQQGGAQAVGAGRASAGAGRGEPAVREFESGADRAPGIAGGGLDPDAIEVRQALQ